MNAKKLYAVVLISSLLAITLAGCGSQEPAAPAPAPPAEVPAAAPEPAPAPLLPEPPATDVDTVSSASRVSMVTDSGGVEDASFNQSAWEGLKRAADLYGLDIKFLESHGDSDYLPNLRQLANEGSNLIWAIGYLMGDAVLEVAQLYPDQLFAIIDYAYAPEDGDNLIGVVFKAQEASFQVGYMAGLTTETHRLGFIGGMRGFVIDQFEFGYRAGVAYAAKELGKNIHVEVEYVGDWVDDVKAYEIASAMYENGADIIFTAAGNAGKGMFEAAIEYDKFCIGVDRDQSDLAPHNTLTSALKLVGNAMGEVSKAVMLEGGYIDYGGTTRVLGLAEGGVGIPNHSLAEPEVYFKTMDIELEIINGNIVVPYDEDSFNVFIQSLR